jgi:hypothetical protein
MQEASRTWQLVAMLGLVVAVLAGGCGGAHTGRVPEAAGQGAPPRSVYPGVIEFRTGPGPGSVWGMNRSHLGAAVNGKGGALEAHGAVLLVTQPEAAGGSMEVWYPTLRIGDLAPALGGLYCVDRIGDPGPPSGRQAWMTMALSAAGLPPGVSFHEGSVGIPLVHDRAGAAQLEFDTASALVGVTAEPAPDDGARGPAANVKVNATDRNATILPGSGPVCATRSSTAKVRRGDVLTIDGHPYKVRNVVPRDEKHRVIGWIELDPGTDAPSEPGEKRVRTVFRDHPTT